MAVTDPADVTGVDYSSDYVRLDVETDETTLADQAIENLQSTWEDWDPNEGDMEVVLIETLAALAAVAVNKAAEMPPAALIALGTKLYGIQYEQGSPATTTLTLTFQDDAGGYHVDAGSELLLSGYAFSVVNDVDTVAGQTQVTGVLIVANDVGTEFNSLTSADWSSISLPVWVTDLATEAATSDGTDPQDDNDYLDMVSRELQLRGRMIVTLPDYERAAVDTPGIGRAYAMTTAARDVTVYLTDPEGLPVPAEVKATLADVYANTRLVNTTVNLADANYTEIDVVYSVAALPGFDFVSLLQTINAMLTNSLSPSGWGTVDYGQPGTSPVSWINDATVRLNKVISMIGNTSGVAYVVANSVTINGSAADFVMPGPVALPTPGTFTGTVAP
jgi:hypothetical protein